MKWLPKRVYRLSPLSLALLACIFCGLALILGGAALLDRDSSIRALAGWIVLICLACGVGGLVLARYPRLVLDHTGLRQYQVAWSLETTGTMSPPSTSPRPSRDSSSDSR
jgi:hypothetical protein